MKELVYLFVAKGRYEGRQVVPESLEADNQDQTAIDFRENGGNLKSENVVVRDRVIDLKRNKAVKV